MDETIHLITLNCWGLRFGLSKYRELRLREIGKRIAANAKTIDLVALQEIWSINDYKLVRTITGDELPFGKFYYSGAFGSGLAILSRWPIQETSMQTYSLNGRPQAFWRGDWYVGKGIARALISHPSGQQIELFNTHLHAPYGKGKDTYLCHRLAQAWEIAKLTRASVKQNHITIATGDFNTEPGTEAYRLIIGTGRVSDAWLLDSRHDIDSQRPVMSHHDLVSGFGVTCDSQVNSWRAMPGALSDMDNKEAKRLDYAFVNPSKVSVQKCDVVFTDNVPETSMSFSDHFGIYVQLQLENKNQLDDKVVETEYIPDSKLFEGIKDEIDWYMARESRHMKWRISYLVLSILVVIALHISVFYLSGKGWAVFLVMLANTIFASTGLVLGLFIGFLFGRFEMRSIVEFKEEVQLMQANIYKEC